MKSILDFSLIEIENEIEKNNMPKYRAKQIFNWIYKKFIFDFDKMTNLPKDTIKFLSENYKINTINKVEYLSDNECIKLLFKTYDDLFFETVIIHDDKNKSHLTLCVSSQIGCPIGCLFCATGKIGFKRNLEINEIISQILIVESFLNINNIIKKRMLTNIVFMGMGEPMLNYENVIKSIKILNEKDGYNIGYRNITISSIGIPYLIDKLANENFQIRLAISLHSPFQNIREKLIPIAKNLNLDLLIESLIRYQKKKDKRITFEYVLIKNLNTREIDAKQIGNLLKNLKFNLNLIVFNPFEENYNYRPSKKEINEFILFLKKYKIPFVIRKSKGSKIRAGCGQLGLFYYKNYERISEK